jgi:hypothetical protein
MTLNKKWLYLPVLWNSKLAAENSVDSVPINRRNSKAMQPYKPAYRPEGTVHELFTAIGVDNEDTSQPKARTRKVLV